MTHLTYRVQVRRQGPEQFTAHILALPGCFTCGHTREQAVRIARDLIESYLQHLALRDRPIPLDDDSHDKMSAAGDFISVTVYAPLPVIA